jgi:hypothetical protein
MGNKREKTKCQVCGDLATRIGKGYKLCQDCYDEVAEWEIIEYNGSLVAFDKLKSKEALGFLRDEVLDKDLMIRSLKDFLIEKKIISEEEFVMYYIEHE